MVAIKFLKKISPGLKLIVSYADTERGHHGGVYQATNWTYTGLSEKAGGFSYFLDGKWQHKRSLGAKYGRRDSKYLDSLFPNAKKKKDSDKHRYLMPLDKEIRKQILPLSQPYPKRVKQAIVDNPINSGGATPTDTLQVNEGA